MPDKTSPAIQTVGLAKAYGSTKALDGLDLTIPQGAVYGLLGPNGAGKTTAVKILATLLRPDGGQARVFGHDVTTEPTEIRRLVSLTGQYASVDNDLTGVENLILLGRLLGHGRAEARARAEKLVDAFGLTEAGGRQVKTYSGGMRRRLDIAASIVNIPRLLFLDEPTTGLDPRSRNHVWDIIRAVVAHGTTVLLTTQYLEEADRLADRLAVIDEGRVIAEGTPGELKASVGAGHLNVRLRHPEGRAAAAQILTRYLDGVQSPERDAQLLTALAPGDDANPASDRVGRALAALTEAGFVVDEFSLGQPSLDDVFLALTDKPAPVHTEKLHFEEVAS